MSALASANNQVVLLVTGNHVHLLNTAAFVTPDSLARTVALIDAHPDFGYLEARLTDRDGHLKPSCRFYQPIQYLSGEHRIAAFVPLGQAR